MVLYLNRLESVSSACSAYSAVGFSYGYNAANQRTNILLSDDSRWSFGYDSLGQVTSGSRRWADNTPVAGQQFGYTFDDIGNRLWTATSGHIAAYTNNLLNQITSRDIPGFAQVIGSANSNATVTLWADNGAYTQTSRKGNYFFGELPVNNSTSAVWLTITNLAVVRNGTNADYVASSVGRMLVAQTPETFLYDADGNLTNDGKWSYTWDAENRLTAMGSAAGVSPAAQYRLEFAYDWQSRRTQKIVYTNDGNGYVGSYTNTFVYDGWNLIAILDSQSSILQSFTWGLDASGSQQGAGGVGGLLSTTIHTGPHAGTYFPLYDGNHNIIAYIRASDGQIVSKYEYGPFGELIRASGPMAREFNFLFSTKYFDWETGLYYYGYRYYDPSTGRWLSRDPVGELDGANLLYPIASGDTINGIDLLGLLEFEFMVVTNTTGPNNQGGMNNRSGPWGSPGHYFNGSVTQTPASASTTVTLTGPVRAHCCNSVVMKKTDNENAGSIVVFMKDVDIGIYSVRVHFSGSASITLDADEREGSNAQSTLRFMGPNDDGAVVWGSVQVGRGGKGHFSWESGPQETSGNVVVKRRREKVKIAAYSLSMAANECPAGLVMTATGSIAVGKVEKLK